MKQACIIFMTLLYTLNMAAQQNKYAGVSFFNTQPDLPFGKFTGLFKEAFHPGVEFTYGNNLNVKIKHNWFLEYKLAYFFHRFVQHGIPTYVNLGYRYRFSKAFSAETSLGAGLMFSIPATQVFRVNREISFEKKKDKGREQAIATYGIGLGYTLNPGASTTWRIVANYQQRIQFPFVKSYVPFLPYNSFMFGITRSIGKNKLNPVYNEKKYRGPVDRLLIQKKL